MRHACALMTALAAALPLRAQTAPAGEIVVTGGGLKQTPGAAAYGTVTVSRARLTAEASGRLEDVLRDVAGVQQFRRTDSRAANPTSQGVTLRALGGNASSRALVLLDGVPQADPFAGYIPWSALTPERLREVRVTRGGGTGAFGAGAVAGTLELDSAGLDDVGRLTARALGGSRGASELALGMAPKLGDGFVALDGRWDRGDGYVLIPRERRGAADIPARYDSWSVGGRAVVPVGPDADLQVRALGFSDHRLRGQAGTRNSSTGTDAGFRLVSRGRWKLDALLYVQNRNFASGFVSTAPDRNSTTPSLDQYKTPALGVGGKLELRPPMFAGNTLRLGLDVRRFEGQTNELFRFQPGGFTRYRRAGGDQLTAGGFVEDDVVLGRLTLTGGARADRWAIGRGSLVERARADGTVTQDIETPARSGWRGSFRAGALLKPSAWAALRAAAYTGFRLPTLNELYRPFRVGADATAANPALGLERLRGAEGGIDLRPAPGVSLSATVFANQLRGAIANVSAGQGPGLFPQVGFVGVGGVYRVRRNVGAIEVTGIELSAAATADAFSLTASAALSSARVRATGLAALLNGLRPANAPVVQASATLAWRHAGADVSATLRHVGAQYDDDLQSRRIPPANTLDGYARVPVTSGLSVIGRVENAFDVRVVSALSNAGVPDLGTPRTLWLGLAFSR